MPNDSSCIFSSTSYICLIGCGSGHSAKMANGFALNSNFFSEPGICLPCDPDSEIHSVHFLSGCRCYFTVLFYSVGIEFYLHDFAGKIVEGRIKVFPYRQSCCFFACCDRYSFIKLYPFFRCEPILCPSPCRNWTRKTSESSLIPQRFAYWRSCLS